MLKNTFLFLFIAWTTGLSCFTVEVTSRPEDIATNATLWISISLTNQQRGIIKDSLRFSVDSPDIHITAWSHTAQSTDFFLPSSKKTVRLFPGAVSGWLDLSFNSHDYNKILSLLEQSSLYVSCFVLSHQGSIKPLCTRVTLNKEQTPTKSLPSEVEIIEQSSAFSLPSAFPLTQDFESDFRYIDRLSQQYVYLFSALSGLFHSIHYWLFFVCLLMLLIVTTYIKIPYVRRYIPYSFIWFGRDIMVLLWFLIMAFCLYSLRWLLTPAWALLVFSVFVFVLGGYILFSSNNEKYFVGRFKSLIGMMSGSFLLPLLVQVWLLFKGM